jgi:hypothetical protein
MRPRGPVTGLTDGLADRFVAQVAAGKNLVDASIALELNYSTVTSWLWKGRRLGQEPYKTFAKRVDAASEDYIRSQVRALSDAPAAS